MRSPAPRGYYPSRPTTPPARPRATSLWGGISPAQLWSVVRLPPAARLPLAALVHRTLTVALAALALVGQVAYLDALHWNSLGVRPLAQGSLNPALLSSVATSAVVTTVALAAALALVFRRDPERGGHPLGLSLATWAYLLSYSGITVLLAPDASSPLRLVYEAHFLFVEALGLAALLRFTALFPTPLTAATTLDPEELPIGLRSAQRVRRLFLTPWGPWMAGAVAPVLLLGFTAFLGRPLQDAALLLPTDLLRLAALSVVVVNLRGAFVSADLEGRRAVFWLVAGFTLLMGAVGALLGGNVLAAVTGWEIPRFNWRPAVLDLGVIGLIWGASMGVLYRGQLRPGLVARRTGVLAGAVTVGLFLAAGLESLVAGVVATRVTLPAGIGTLVAGLAMGLLYVRTRRPIESMIYHAWAAGPDDGTR